VRNVFTARRAMLARYMPSTCVCLSVVYHKLVFYETVKRRIMQTTPHDGPGTTVF